MKKNIVTDQQFPRRGFTLVEIMTIILLVMLLAIMGAPLFNSLVKSYRLQQDVVDVERIVRVTMSEAMQRGAVGQVTIDSANGTIVGGIFETDGTFLIVEDFTLREATFGRTNSTRTPWLGYSDTGTSTYVGDVINIDPNGLASQSGAVFLNYRGEEAAMEILISGTVSVFFQEEGGATWSN